MRTGNEETEDSYTIWDSGWTMRVRPASHSDAGHVIVLLHGWTGDEYSMDLFSSWMPISSTLIFPRAPVPAQPTGFGWLPHADHNQSSFTDFAKVCLPLWNRIVNQLNELHLSSNKISIVGFSQGAALAITMATLYASQINNTVILAGYLPDNMPGGTPDSLRNQNIFIAHGIRDDIIPYNCAQQIRNYFVRSGAHVTFCESNSGHKLTTRCLAELAKFLNDRSAPLDKGNDSKENSKSS